MNYVILKSFMDDLKKITPALRNKALKRVTEVAEMYGYQTPGSWHLEKIGANSWTIRLNKSYRVAFSVIDGKIFFSHVGPHDLYKRI